MQHDPVQLCCTASFFCDFGGSASTSIKKWIAQEIPNALRNRKAMIHAYTTASQREANTALEESGFLKVMDVKDYKYPTSSRRLYLWALDLNTKKDQPVVVAAPVNPFVPAAAPVHQRRVQPRLQNGTFMPGIGREFIVDFNLPIPESWEGMQFNIFSPVENRWMPTVMGRNRIAAYRISPRIPETTRRIRRVA